MTQQLSPPAKFALFFVFSICLAGICYFRPLQDDLDRYMYEALIRSGRQPTNDIYAIVKHESPRAEASTVLDSPEHLAQLEPLYAIRPAYVRLGKLLTRVGLAPQKAINLISAGSLFLLALLTFGATRSFLYSALLIITPGILTLGRLGTPDALSCLIVVAGLIAVMAEKQMLGIVLLLMSIPVRTDNVLIVLAILMWMAWKKRLPIVGAGALCAFAIACVEWINFSAHNYGWKVLLHYSFVGGRYPAQITSGITLSQYARSFVGNMQSVLPQLAVGLLLGLIVWRSKQAERFVLVPVALACALHYALFPSGEARYLTWADFFAGILFVRWIVAGRRLMELGFLAKMSPPDSSVPCDVETRYTLRLRRGSLNY